MTCRILLSRSKRDLRNDMKNKSRELLNELRTVFSGRNSFLDAILPPILFLLVNGLVSFQAAMWCALALSVVIAAVRIVRKQSLLYALAGVGSVAVAIGIAWFLDKSEGFFLPGLISGSMTLLLTVVSLVIRRPMVAWTSYIAAAGPWTGTGIRRCDPPTAKQLSPGRSFSPHGCFYNTQSSKVKMSPFWR